MYNFSSGIYNHVQVDLVDLRWGVRSAEMGSGQVENCIQQVLAADLFIGIILSFSLNILGLSVSVFASNQKKLHFFCGHSHNSSWTVMEKVKIEIFFYFLDF